MRESAWKRAYITNMMPEDAAALADTHKRNTVAADRKRKRPRGAKFVGTQHYPRDTLADQAFHVRDERGTQIRQSFETTGELPPMPSPQGAPPRD